MLSCKGEGASILDSGSGTTLRLGTGWILSRMRQEKTVLFTTVRKFKGLEAKVVICIDMDEETFFEERERNAFYVGMSRAATYLNLITTTMPEMLATALNGGERVSGPRCRKVIRDSLCIKIGDGGSLDE